MKNFKLFLLLFSTFMCLNSSAQIFVGGNIRLDVSNNTTSDNSFSSHDIVLSPDFGKYISDKLAVGISLNFTSRKRKNTGSLDDKFSAIGLSPFLKYDFFKLGKFSIYGQGNFGVDFRKQIPYSTTEVTKSIRTYVSFNPGLSYNLNDHILLQTSAYFLSFGYEYISSINKTPEERSSSFNLSTTLDNVISLFPLNIGAIYRF